MPGNISDASSSNLCPGIFLRPQVQNYARKYSWSLKFKSISGNIPASSFKNPCPEIFVVSPSP